MNTHKPLLVLVLAVSAAFCAAAAPPAQATTFCVPDHSPACPQNGVNVAMSNLETAAHLDTDDGVADTIVLAAGTFSDDDGFDVGDGDDALTIVGAGRTDTTLTSTTMNPNAPVVDLPAARDVTLRDLRIAIPDTTDGLAGVGLRGDTLERVDIEAHGSSASGVLAQGGSIRDSRIRAAAGGSLFEAVWAYGGTITVDRSELAAQKVGVRAEVPTAVLVRASRLDTQYGAGVSATSGGSVNVVNSVLTSGGGVGAGAYCHDDKSSSVTLTHSTLVNRGMVPGSVGVKAIVDETSSDEGSCTATVSNSIVRGFDTAYERTAPNGAKVGDANLTVIYSDMPLATGTSTGEGVVDLGTGNIDADPMFVGEDDLRLRAGSPAIDRGFAGGLGIAGDFDGAAREVDGDGDGTARRDMGAYEFLSAPPPQPGAGGAGGGAPGGATVPAPGGTPTPTPTPTTTPAPKVDRTAPAITRLRVVRGGRALRFSLSEAAKLRVTINGRRRTVAGRRGLNTVRIARLGRRYRVMVLATDAAGNRSRPARLTRR